MKSMFVVSEGFVNRHVGEEYDVIVEVSNEPTTDNIQTYAEQVMGQIKELWNKQEGYDKKVIVYLDAAVPFAAMLANLKIIMKEQSGIQIELPWDNPPNLEELDSESKEILKKLENK